MGALYYDAALRAPLGMTDADADPPEPWRAMSSVGMRGWGRPCAVWASCRLSKPDEGPAVDAAGGINASISDMAKWLQVQLSGGLLP